MTTTRRIAVLLLALALVAAACGDDDDAGTDTTAGTTTTASTDDGGGDDTTTTTAGDSGETTTTAGGSDGNGGGDITGTDIDELIQRFEDTPLRATYLFGADPDAMVVVLSQDPTANPPLDAFIMLGAPPGTAEEGRVITAGDTLIFCGPPGEGCFSSPADGAAGGMADAFMGPLVAGFLLGAVDANSPAFDIDTEAVTIAGRDGICFTFTPEGFVNADVEFVRQCIDSEIGLTLLIEGKDAGGATVDRIMELTEFDRPQPGDFEPNGPVTEFPEG